MVEIRLDKIFDPFHSNNANEKHNSAQSYDVYDNLRMACSFHLPADVKNVITKNSEKLNILHLNARSLVNKLDDLCTLMTETDVCWHIISVSETWLSKDIEDRYNLTGYNSLFYSRCTSAGGGSALYVKDHLHQTQLNLPQFTTAEAVGSEVKISENRNILVCQIYKSPNTDKQLFNDELEQCLIYLNRLNKTTLITGDFNFDLFSIENSSTAHSFFNTLLSHGFFPTISRTTRSAHPSHTLLDNIFCNDLSRVMHSGVILNDLSDHFPIFSSLTFNVGPSKEESQRKTTQQIFDYKKN